MIKISRRQMLLAVMSLFVFQQAVIPAVWDENYKTEPYYAKSKSPLVIMYDNGLIFDLSANLIAARGEFPLTGFGTKSKIYTENNATVNSKKALTDLAGQIRVDADNRLGYLTSNNSNFAARINNKINEISKAMHYRILPMKMVLRVTSKAKFYGKNSLLSAVYPYLASINPEGANEGPEASSEAAPAQPALSAPGQYTGLIIDAGGLKLEPAIDPCIKDADGNTIFGKIKTKDLEVIFLTTKVEYAKGMKEANLSLRGGKRPLVIRAKSAIMNCDPVVSKEDGQLILKENDTSRFLDGFNVVVVI